MGRYSGRLTPHEYLRLGQRLRLVQPLAVVDEGGGLPSTVWTFRRLTSRGRSIPEEQSARTINAPSSLIGDDCENATAVSIVPAGRLPYGCLYDKAKQLLIQTADRPALLKHTEERTVQPPNSQ